MSLADRIKQRRADLYLSQAEVGKHCGVSQQAIEKIERGETLRPKYLVELAEILQTTTRWLLKGGVPSFSPHSESTLPVEKKAFVQAGELVEANELLPDEREVFQVVRPRHPFAHYSIIEVRGDSMNVYFPHGTDLLCVDWFDFDKCGYELKTDDFVIVRRRDGDGLFEFTCKQLEIRDGECLFWPRSTNKNHQHPLNVPEIEGAGESDAGINDGDVQIVGVVLHPVADLIASNRTTDFAESRQVINLS